MSPPTWGDFPPSGTLPLVSTVLTPGMTCSTRHRPLSSHSVPVSIRRTETQTLRAATAYPIAGKTDNDPNTSGTVAMAAPNFIDPVIDQIEKNITASRMRSLRRDVPVRP